FHIGLGKSRWDWAHAACFLLLFVVVSHHFLPGFCRRSHGPLFSNLFHGITLLIVTIFAASCGLCGKWTGRWFSPHGRKPCRTALSAFSHFHSTTTPQRRQERLEPP